MQRRAKLAVISGGVLLGAVSSAQAQLYSTGFEQPGITTGSIAGQDGWYLNGAPNYEGVVDATSTSPAGNAASNNNPLSGNQSYRIKGSDFAEHLIGTTSEGMIYGYTQQLDPPSTPGGGDGGLFSSLSMNNSDGLTYAQVIFGEKAYYGSNQINLLTGSTETPVATFTDAQAHDTWRLDLNFNYAAQTYSVTYADLTTGDAPITSSAVAFNLPAAPGGAGGLPSSDDVFDIRVRFGGLIDDVGVPGGGPPPGPATWTAPAAGSWLVRGNWSAAVPNAVDAVAQLTGAITANSTIYADAPITVGTLIFNNPEASYHVTGSSTLTLQVSTGEALVDVQAGAHKINLPLIIASNTNLQVAAGAALKISDPVTVNAGQSLAQSGAGTVTYESTIDVQNGGSIAFGSSSHVASLSLASAAMASIAQGGGKVLTVDNLNSAGTTNAWTSQIDVKDNDVIVKSSSGGRVAKAAEITNQLKQGANFANAGQFWTGNGMITSLGGNGSTSYTAVGVAVNDFALLGGAQTGAIYSTFDGQNVGVNDVLVKYTYFGDADLDGAVTTNDYFQIDNGFLGSKTGWINGDFDYDGAVTTNDYFLIDNAFLGQGAAITPASVGSASALSGVTAVPEPTSIGIFAFAAAGLVLRRRRNLKRRPS